MISWSNFFKKLLSDFKNKGYKFNHVAELNFITIANEMVMSFVFYIKLNMHAVEWKLDAMVDKNKKFGNKLKQKWRHLLIRKFEHVPI